MSDIKSLMNEKENIKKTMYMVLSSEGKTFVWNPQSKFQTRRKIQRVRLSYGGNVELTFSQPLPNRTSHLFTVEPTVDCLKSFSIVD